MNQKLKRCSYLWQGTDTQSRPISREGNPRINQDSFRISLLTIPVVELRVLFVISKDHFSLN